MPKPEWMEEKFVQKELTKKGKDKRGCIHWTKLVEKMGSPEAPQAWVVSIGWLFQQLVKCTQEGQETMRFAVDSAGELHIEGYADAADIDGSTDAAGIDPPAWNNDWPKITLP